MKSLIAAVYIFLPLFLHAQGPIADFSANVTSGLKPLSVTFTDLSVPAGSAIVDWNWRFGDGSVVVGVQSPTHIYNETGDFTVILTVRDALGRIDSDTVLNYISVLGPRAVFTASVPREGVGPLPVTFTDASYDNSGGTITSWYWEFGDGYTSTLSSPTHTFQDAGKSFDARFVGNGGDKHKDIRDPVITARKYRLRFNASLGNGPISLSWNQSLAASYATTMRIVDPLTGGIQVNFNMKTNSTFNVQTNGGGHLTNELDIEVVPSTLNNWVLPLNVSDGAADTTVFFGINPAGLAGVDPLDVLITPFNGLYNVRLTITNNSGVKDQQQELALVKVVQPLFFAYPTAGALPQTVAFNDTSMPDTGPIVNWTWDFGDGSPVSHLQNPQHEYLAAESFTVRLTLEDGRGQTSSLEKPFYIDLSSGPIISTPIPQYTHRAQGSLIDVTIRMDLNQTDGFSVGGFGAFLQFDPAVLAYRSGSVTGFNGNVNPDTLGPGNIYLNGASLAGKTGVFNIATITFHVIGSAGQSTGLDLNYVNLVRASTFQDLLPYVVAETRSIQIINRPNAQFTVDRMRAWEQVEFIQFTDISTPGDTTLLPIREWVFGDGSTSSLLNPQHAFILPLNYPDVTASFDSRLVVFDNYGETDTAVVNDLIIDRAFRQNLFTGWNLTGLPDAAINKSVDFLYPDRDGSVYNWTGSQYASVATLQLNKGYWVNYPFATPIRVAGPPVYTRIDTLMTGWNIVPGVSGKVSREFLDAGDVLNLIQGSVWEYTGVQYQVADTLRPGKGYWINSRASGVIGISSLDHSYFEKTRKKPKFDLNPFPYLEIADENSGNRKLYLNVTYSDPYSEAYFALPPLPPVCGFDARYDNDLFISPDSLGTILIQSQYFPLTLQSADDHTHSFNYVIQQYSQDKLIKTSQIRSGESLAITDATITHLFVVLKENRLHQSIPLIFRVEQNYPNPFNPLTTIRYALPFRSEVNVRVYNMIGQQIRQLFSGIQEAGYYDVQWNGRNDAGEDVGSGVYFYTVSSGENMRSFKMLLLK